MKTTQTAKIIDCLDGMKQLQSKSIDCAILDPPYYKVVTEKWDNQWKSFQEYLDWLEVRCIELKRVLKDNGSFYIFGDDQSIAYIQVMLDKHFSFLNHLIWYKRNNHSIKGADNSRRFACVSERILFYSLQDSTRLSEIHDSKECFRPIKDYMIDECNKLKEQKGYKTKEELNQYLNELTGTASAVSRHYFCDSQWVFPTKEIYLKLQSTGFFRREYEDLRREYEDLRRVFHPSHKQYEIIDIPIINPTENTTHRTTKPLALIKKLLKAITNEGMTVLDPFAGSWVTLEAGQHLNLNVIGFDIDDTWMPDYHRRLKSDNAKLDAWTT
jgi:site-specific DNA-methyltransferase (adenine-specific)